MENILRKFKFTKMKWNLCLQIALCGLCCLASGFQAGTATVPASSSSKPCYVEQSESVELIIRMNTTVQILTGKETKLNVTRKIQFVEVDTDNMHDCTEDRIEGIQKKIVEITSRLYQLAFRNEKPSELDVLNLEVDKVRLVDNLKALRIFTYGPSSNGKTRIVLYPFETIVTAFENSLDDFFKRFFSWPQQSTTSTTTTTTAPTTTTTTSTTAKPIVSWNDLKRLNSTEVSRVLPQLIPQLYARNVSNFGKILSNIASLPNAENQIIAFSAIWSEVQRYSPVPQVPQLLNMLEKLKRLEGTVSKSSLNSVGISARSKLADLLHELNPLKLIGENANCYVTNVAYQQYLFTSDFGWPQSAYLVDTGIEWSFSPSVKSGKLTYRIGLFAPFVLFASGSNQNREPRDVLYQTKSSERYVLKDSKVPLGADADWKLVPVRGKVDQFKIVVSKTDEVMFAHKTAKGGLSGDLRRVVVKNYLNQDYVPEADHWRLKCRPEEYNFNGF